MQTVKIMEETFKAESSEIALYLAMSRKAEEEGHPEIATYLHEVAMDEAWHAAEFALLLGKVRDTRSNLLLMLEGEIKEEKDKEEAAKIAMAEGHEEAFQFFNKAMHDESKHKTGIKDALLKLGKRLNQR